MQCSVAGNFVVPRCDRRVKPQQHPAKIVEAGRGKRILVVEEQGTTASPSDRTPSRAPRAMPANPPSDDTP
jgi:hypothetical protein